MLRVPGRQGQRQDLRNLGMAFNFSTGLIGIKEKRRDDLLAQLESILSANELHP